MQKPSPVHALSLDTLEPIFKFAVNSGQTPEEITTIPLILSQVCSTWRRSALRSASLWTNVLVDVRGDQSLEQATEYLSRSRTLPVCVTLDIQGTRQEPPGLKERLRFLAPYAHRLRAFHIRGAATAVPIHRFLRDLDFSLTGLKDFEITWGKPTKLLAQHFTVQFGNEVQPAMLPYHLDFSPHNKFTDLTRFALKAYHHRLEIKMDQLLDILGNSPTLQHLELEGFYLDFEDDEFYYDDDPDAEKTILQLPHLQFLSLKQCSSGAFLPRINVPAATNVVLVANDPFMLDEDIHAEPPSILYALPPHFEELSFIGKFQTLDFEVRDSSIILRASQSNGQYLFIEQVLTPNALHNTAAEEMVLPSVVGFANDALGPVKSLRASNRLSETKRGILRDADRSGVRGWLSSMSGLEKLEILHFPLNILEGFAGEEAKQQSPLAAKDVTLTLYPNECGNFEELKTWIKARAEAQLPFEKLEILLDCSVPDVPPVDGELADSLRSSLAAHVKDVVVRVLCSPQ